MNTVWKFLSTLKRTAPSPDELPFWIWRDYAYQLAPTITKVFNSSLKKQLVPCLWKLANITPISKETPLETCNQPRPISLTKGRYVFLLGGGGGPGYFRIFFARKMVVLPLPGMD